jgi:hypothetical protein
MKLATSVGHALLGIVLSASPLHALDLTGTWDGTWSCAGFDGTKYAIKAETSVLKITHGAGRVARASIDDFYFYAVAVVPEGQKPEESAVAALDECGTDDAPLAGSESELMRAKVTSKAGRSKTVFSGTSVFEDGFGSVGTCEYSYVRRDTVDPGVPPCP